MKKVIFSFGALLLMCIGMVSFVTAPKQNTPWIVPDKNKAMKNPVTFDKSAAATLYATHCKSCHGKTGLGDGTKAAQLKTPCGDMSTAAFQKQTDGALFYKVSEGRDDMPSFKKKIADPDDIWQLVHYMRTFAE